MERESGNDSLTLRPDLHLHLVGVGGSGMSAIAWVLLDRGFSVSGSDLQANDLTAALQEAGAVVHQGHAADHVAGADAVVASSAIPEDNAEVAAARAAGLPVLKRADFLGLLMAEKMGVAVAGTHGKTTTASLIAHLLLESGRDPSVVVGGVLPGLERNGRAGQGDVFVVEADEYDHMFLGLRPRIAVVTNVEHDHPDIFPTPADYRRAFQRFVGLLPAGGALVACADDEGVRRLLAAADLDGVDVVTYGLEPGEDDDHYSAVEIRPNQLGGSDFLAVAGDQTLGLARLRLPGRHNVRNALAALAVCRLLGLSFTDVQHSLAAFGGVGRRFQVTGEIGDVTVIDDYAHHPTEIRATLAAARQRYPGRRLWAVWQPHTYSRTKLLLDAFAASFDDADRVVVLDIYRSREQDTLGVDAGQVVARMDHEGAHHIGRRRDAAAYILDRVRPGDVVLTLGAGDGDQVGRWVLEGLQERIETS